MCNTIHTIQYNTYSTLSVRDLRGLRRQHITQKSITNYKYRRYLVSLTLSPSYTRTCYICISLCAGVFDATAILLILYVTFSITLPIKYNFRFLCGFHGFSSTSSTKWQFIKCHIRQDETAYGKKKLYVQIDKYTFNNCLLSKCLIYFRFKLRSSILYYSKKMVIWNRLFLLDTFHQFQKWNYIDFFISTSKT